MKADRRTKEQLLREIEELKADLSHKGSVARKDMAKGAIELCEGLYDAISEGILVADIKSHKLVYANKAVCKMLGHACEELLSMTFKDIHPPEVLEGIAKQFQKQAEGKLKQARSVPCLKKDGSIVHFDIRTNVIRVNGSEYLMGFFMDISERLKVEKELHRRQAHFAEFMNATTSAVNYWKVPDGLDIRMPAEKQIELMYGSVCLEANKQSISGFGYKSREEVVGKTILELLGDQKLYHDTLKKFIKDGYKLFRYGIKHLTPSFNYYGSETWFGVVEDGMLVNAWSISEDITKQKGLEQALRDSEANLKQAQEVARLGSWTIDHKENKFTASGELFSIYEKEYDPDYSLDAFRDAIHPDDIEMVNESSRKNFREKDPLEMVYRIISDKGKTKYVQTRSNCMYSSSGKPLYTIGTTQDITALKQTEAELEYYEQIVSNSSDMLAMVSSNFTFLAVNDEYAKAFGKDVSEFRGLKSKDIFSAEVFRTVIKPNADKCMKGQRVHFRDWVQLPAYGKCYLDVTYNPFYEAGKVRGFIVGARDITNLMEAEQSVKQSLAMLQTAEEIGAMGSWDWDRRTDRVRISENALKLLGIEEDKFFGFPDAIRGVVLRDDYIELVSQVSEMLDSGQESKMEFRIRLPDTSIAIIEGSTQLHIDETGEIIRLVGYIRNITKEKRSSEVLAARLRLLEYAGKSSVKALVQKFLDEIEVLTGSQIGFYHFVADDQENLSLYAWSTNTLINMCTTLGEGTHYPLSMAGVWADCARTKEPVIHNDYEKLKDKKGMPDGHPPVKRELVVPMMRDNKLVSIIGVGNKKSNYEEHDVEIMMELGEILLEIIFRKKAEEAFSESAGQLRKIVLNTSGKKGEEYFRDMVKILEEVTSSSYTFISGLGEDDDFFTYAVSKGGRILENYSYRQDGSPCHEVIEERKCIYREAAKKYNTDYVLLNKLGVNNYVGAPVYDRDNNVVGVVASLYEGSVDDIELVKSVFEVFSVNIGGEIERLRTEGILQQSNKMLEQAESVGLMGSWEWDMATNKVTFSKNAFNLYGLKPEDYDGNFESVFKVFHPDDRDDVKENIIQMLAEKKPRLYSYRVVHPDGSVRNIEGTNQMFYNSRGDITTLLGYIQDVTERKKAESEILKLNKELELRVLMRTNELQKEKQFTDAILDSLPGIFYTCNTEGEFLKWNRNMEEISGYGKNKLASMLVSDLFAEEDKEQLRKYVDIAFRRGKSVTEVKVLTSKGGKIPFYLTGRRFGKGGAKMLIGSGFDVSDLKKAQNALMESEKRFRELADLLPGVIYEVDREGKLTYLNKFGFRLLKVTKKDMAAGIDIFKIVASEDHGKLRANLEKRYVEGDTTPAEYEMLRKDGKRLTGLTFINPVIVEGYVLGIRGILIDITERKKAQAEILKLSRAIESSPSSVVIADNEGRVEYVNPEFVRQLGYRPKEVIGMNPRVWNSGKHTPGFYKNLWATVLKGKVWTGDILNKRKNGELIWERKAIAPIKNNEGDITSFVSVSENITYRKQMEIELKEAKNTAEAANRSKSEFLANMSHEIRTPMNSILGFSEILSQQLEDNRHKSYVDSIQSSGRSLLNLINDILDLSKVEAGKIDIKYENVNSHAFINELVNIFQLKVKQKDLEFRLVIDRELARGINIDGQRVRQILMNLLSNAIKFTDKGYIKLTVSQESIRKTGRLRKNGLVNLKISVRDTGKGIKKQFMSKIFSSFEQEDGKISRKYGGTGLGLAISKQLANMMNGDIILESEHGKGSTFTLILNGVKTFKDTMEDERESFVMEDIVFEPASIYVADDMEDIRKYFIEVLGGMGHSVKAVDNGRKLLKLAEKEPPDLIITDIRMPVMDGHELVRKLRSDKSLKDIPVIAFSASVMKDSLEKIKKSGFNGLLIKPVQLHDLVKELMRMLPFRNLAGESTEVIEVPEEGKDNPENLPEVIKELEGRYMDIWKEFRDKQPMQEVKRFAEDIRGLGIQMEIDSLKLYGESIVGATDSFDIEVMQKRLKDYPRLIKRLKEKL